MPINIDTTKLRYAWKDVPHHKWVYRHGDNSVLYWKTRDGGTFRLNMAECNPSLEYHHDNDLLGAFSVSQGVSVTLSS